MKIVLMRHGKPRLPYFKKMTGSQFDNWVNAYNDAHLDENCSPPDESKQIAKNCSVVICSTLCRSLESFKKLELSNEVEISSDFVEAGIPSCNVFNLKFSERFWLVFFRILWLMGYSPNSESFLQAKSRAKICSVKLVSTAEDRGSVIVVGHGILNKLISKELKKRGWQRVNKVTNDYWQFAIFEHTGK